MLDVEVINMPHIPCPTLDDCYTPPHLVSAMTDAEEDELRVLDEPIIWFENDWAWMCDEDDLEYF